MRIKRHGGTLAGASSPLKITTSLKDRESPEAPFPHHEAAAQTEATPSPHSGQENQTAGGDAATPEEPLAQAPYSPSSNPFGVRPRTRTPAGSLAAARRDSGGLPVSMPRVPTEGADADPGHLAPPSTARRQLAVTLPLTLPGSGTGTSSPAVPSPGFSDMGGFSGDEEAQSWLTSPEVRPVDVETAWEAAGRLTELYDEALLHTMRTAQSRAGQSMDELPARERSAEPDVIPEAPGVGPLPTLAEDEELDDDGTGLVGRLPLADFGEGPSPLAFPTRLQSPTSGPFAFAPDSPMFVLSPEEQLQRSIGDAERIREQLVAEGDDVRASLEAAAASIRALAAAGADPETPAPTQAAGGGAFASPISTTDSPAATEAAAPTSSPDASSGGSRQRRNIACDLAAAAFQALLAAAVLCTALGLSGLLPPLHGWGASPTPGGRVVFPHTAAQTWAGTQQAARGVPLVARWLPAPEVQPQAPPRAPPKAPPAKPQTMAQHLRQHAGALWKTVQGSTAAGRNAATAGGASDAEPAAVPTPPTSPPPPPPSVAGKPQAPAAVAAPAGKDAAGGDPTLTSRLLQSLSATVAAPPAPQPQEAAHKQAESAAAAKGEPADAAAADSMHKVAAPAAHAAAGTQAAASTKTAAADTAAADHAAAKPTAAEPAAAEPTAAERVAAGPAAKPGAAAAGVAERTAATAPAVAPAAMTTPPAHSPAVIQEAVTQEAATHTSWSAIEAAARRIVPAASSHAGNAVQQPHWIGNALGSVNWAAAAAVACAAAFAVAMVALLWRGYLATLALEESSDAAQAATHANEAWEAASTAQPAEGVDLNAIPSPVLNGTPSVLPPLPTFGAPSTRRSTRARPTAQSAPAAAARYSLRRLSAAPSASLQSGHAADESALLEDTAEGPESASPSELVSQGGSQLAARGTAAAAAGMTSVGRATRSMSRRLSAAVSGMAADADAGDVPDVVSPPPPRRGAAPTRHSRPRRA